MACILLVEPNTLLARAYGEALLRVGHTVQMVTSAQSAISAADTTCPDLIILELQLVGHNGLEFLYEFRSYPDWQHVPLILLTHVPPEEFHDSWELLRSEFKVNDYLYKPATTLRKLTQSVATVTEAWQ
jgi:CheY-like chemotaxis protein